MTHCRCTSKAFVNSSTTLTRTAKICHAVKTIRLISAREYADEIVDTTESDDLEEDENDDPDNAAICGNIEFQLYRFIIDNGLRSTFANTEIALCIQQAETD